MTELQWSSSALHARSVFFEEFNDIDIYVEDTDATTIRIFTTLLQRVMENVRIETVFGLGGKHEVLKRFNSDANNTRKRLYIIDGDFSCILGDLCHHEVPAGVFRLSRYCIENYLIDTDAFFQVAHDEDGSRGHAELRQAAKLSEWMESTATQLLRLSLAYACNEFFELGLKTCSRHVEDFYRDGEGTLSEDKIEAAIEEIRAATDAKTNAGTFDAKLEVLLARASLIDLAHVAIPSGKGYCLPLFLRKLKWLTKSKTSDKSLTMRLSRYAELGELKLTSSYVLN